MGFDLYVFSGQLISRSISSQKPSDFQTRDWVLADRVESIAVHQCYAYSTYLLSDTFFKTTSLMEAVDVRLHCIKSVFVLGLAYPAALSICVVCYSLQYVC